MTRRGRILSEIGTSLNVFSEPILFHGRQCIALRGDNKVLNGEGRGNTGNFLAALQMIANHDDNCMGQEKAVIPSTNAHPLSN